MPSPTDSHTTATGSHYASFGTASPSRAHEPTTALDGGDDERHAYVQDDFAFHPLAVWCDNTTEFLAGMLRTGKAGSNTAADHISVLTDAIT